MDFSISMPGDNDKLRQAYRTRVPGFMVLVKKLNRQYEVKDLSATGFAVMDKEEVFSENTEFEVDFILNKKPFITDINSIVMRVVGNGIVGFNFVDLERKKQIKLDKLVLEVQKRLIALRKKREK